MDAEILKDALSYLGTIELDGKNVKVKCNFCGKSKTTEYKKLYYVFDWCDCMIIPKPCKSLIPRAINIIYNTLYETENFEIKDPTMPYKKVSYVFDSKEDIMIKKGVTVISGKSCKEGYIELAKKISILTGRKMEDSPSQLMKKIFKILPPNPIENAIQYWYTDIRDITKPSLKIRKVCSKCGITFNVDINYEKYNPTCLCDYEVAEDIDEKMFIDEKKIRIKCSTHGDKDIEVSGNVIKCT